MQTKSSVIWKYPIIEYRIRNPDNALLSTYKFSGKGIYFKLLSLKGKL